MTDLVTKIKIMQAALDGEEIEWVKRGSADDTWTTHSRIDIHQWDWSTFDYRIKPKPLEFWVNVYEGSGACFGFHTSKLNADQSKTKDCIKTIKVKEVTDE